MAEVLIRTLDERYAQYLRDESRTVGRAESISFPRDESQVRALLRQLSAAGTPVTVQGGRTGLAAGAVPFGGHVMSLTRMDAVLGLRQVNGRFRLRVQPGLALAQLNKQIHTRVFDTTGWAEEDRAAYAVFRAAEEQFFSPDPTETSATLGGMAACNASGARSYRYGPTRGHITALRLVLAGGETLALRRGEVFAQGRTLALRTEQGRCFTVPLPGYTMPATKSASGYYVTPDMDAIDLIIGSDGTLGVLTELELELLPLPKVIWGASCFFDDWRQALDFVATVRAAALPVAALEYFDRKALAVLSAQRARGGAFAQLPRTPEGADAAVYAELHCDTAEQAMAALARLGERMRAAGGDPERSWVARTGADLDTLKFFRHAVPESVNMLIDRRKQEDPVITKLGTDMSVPAERLGEMMERYQADLRDWDLDYAIWGHIGDSHLHVNILPRSGDEWRRGKQLYERWARAAAELGGAVSAEHGVGKLKAAYLQFMYGPGVDGESRRLKAAFDPLGLLGRGNLIGEAEL